MLRAIEYQRLLESLSDDSLPLDGTHRQHNLLADCPRGGHRDDTVANLRKGCLDLGVFPDAQLLRR